MSSNYRVLPQCGTFYIPPCHVEPTRHWLAWATIDLVRWAESGGWHDASWNDLPLDVWSCSVKMSRWRRFNYYSMLLTSQNDREINESIFWTRLKGTYSVRNSTLLKRQVLVALLTFRLTEQGTYFCAHEKKQRILASSYSCTCHILATYVALMVWSNHDENIHFTSLKVL